MFSREDWTMFRNLNTISQKAGVPLHSLRRLVIKELVDNSLDECGEVRFGKIGDNTYWVADSGKGINLDEDGLSNLFSINRPLTSSKILRIPSRGALGNGLRVVVGSVMASGGTLEVQTGGSNYHFIFNDQTGRSKAIFAGKSESSLGTKIIITFGESVPADRHDLLWANLAHAFHSATRYAEKSSPFWYDSDSFYELLMAAGNKQLSWLMPQFEGVNKVSETISAIQNAGIKTESPFSEFSREDSDTILGTLRQFCKPVGAKKIGGCGLAAKKIGEV